MSKTDYTNLKIINLKMSKTDNLSKTINTNKLDKLTEIKLEEEFEQELLKGKGKPVAKEGKSKGVEIDSSWMLPNVICWVMDEKVPEVYVKGTIVNLDSANPNNVVVMLEGGKDKKTVETKLLELRSLEVSETPLKTKDDMVEMEILNVAELLYNLFVRLKYKLPYTYIGQTLIAINPFTFTLGLYTPEVCKFYTEKQIIN